MRRRLVMHSSQRAFFLVERNGALDERRVQAVRGQFAWRPTVGEKSALILEPPGLHDECSLKLCFLEDHKVAAAVGMLSSGDIDSLCKRIPSDRISPDSPSFRGEA